MRRDRILYCAAVAALGVIPRLAQANENANLVSQQLANEFGTSIGAGSSSNPYAAQAGNGVFATSSAWISPWSTNNGTTIAGSWNTAANWNPAVVPGTGGTATFGDIGDLAGNRVFMDTNPTLSGLTLGGVDHRLLSVPTSIGGTTAKVSAPAGGTLTINASADNYPVSPSWVGTVGLLGPQIQDYTLGGGAGTTVVKTGIGSINLVRNNSTNQDFNIKQGTVMLWDQLAINGGGSPISNTNDDSVFGTGVLTIDGGQLLEWDVGGAPTNMQFNHPVVIGPNGGAIRPLTDIPSFNSVISGTGTLRLGAGGDASYNAAMTYSGDTVIESGLFLHFVVANSSALNTNFRNQSRIDFDANSAGSTQHDRIGDTKSITLLGGGIKMQGNPNFDFSEKWGTTNAASGVGYMWMFPDINHSASFAMDNLNVTDGVLFIRAINLGQTGAFTSQVVVNNGVTQVGGGGAAGTTTQSIAPGVYGFSGSANSDVEGGGFDTAGLMTYVPGTGFRALDLATEYVNTINASTNAADNVWVFDNEAVGSAKTINALVMHDLGAASTNYSITGAPLTVTSGMIISGVGTTSTATIANNVNFGSAKGNLISIGVSTTNFGGTLAITGAISGSGGVLVSGGGDVVLSGASTYTGNTTISAARVLLLGDVKADGVTPGPLGLSTTPIRLVTANDGPTTTAGSGRYGTSNSMLLNGSAGAITIDRDILVTGTADFSDGAGPTIGNRFATNTTTYTGNINIGGEAKLIVQNPGTITFNGPITGAGVLRTTGSGVYNLNVANTYSGGTELQFGTTGGTIGQYVLGNDAAFGTGKVWVPSQARQPILIAGGGPRTIANDFGGAGGFNVFGSNPMTFTGNIDTLVSTFLGGNTFIIDNTATTTFAGSVQRGGLVKAINNFGTFSDLGNGTLVLSGNNSSMTGVVQVGGLDGATATPYSAGVLQVTNSTALGAGGMVNNNTTVVTKSTLELNATGPNIALTDFVTMNGTGSANLGAIHNKAGNNTFNGANISLARFAGTAPAVEAASNSSIRVEPGTSLSLLGAGATQVNGSINDVSGLGVASVSSQSETSWTPATRGAGTATFSKEGAGTLTINRISNLKISTETTAPGADGSGVFRHQFIDRVPFETLNVNAGTMAIALGRNTSPSRVVQDTHPPFPAGVTSGPFLQTPSTNKTTIVRNQTIAPAATLDLGNNDMVQDYSGTSPLQSYRTMIQSAYNNGSWNGTGLTSSAAQSQSTAAHKTALGYAEASAVRSTFPATFSGVDVPDSTGILTRYTWSGDSNLDGTVDLSDFTFLAANFNGSGKTWLEGDYNYDGTVNLTDFAFLASNFNQAAFGDDAGAAGASLGGLVPEPTSLGLMGLVAGGLLARRRRMAR